MKLKAKSLKDGSCRNVAEDRVIQVTAKQPLQTYLERRQEKVVV